MRESSSTGVAILRYKLIIRAPDGSIRKTVTKCKKSGRVITEYQDGTKEFRRASK